MSIRVFVLLVAACLVGLGAVLGIRRRPAIEPSAKAVRVSEKTSEPAVEEVRPKRMLAVVPRLQALPAVIPATPVREVDKHEWEISLSRLSRMAALLFMALTLGGAAYFGLHGGSSSYPPTLTTSNAFAASLDGPDVHAATREAQSLKSELQAREVPASPPAAPLAEPSPAPTEAPPPPTPAVAAAIETPAPEPQPTPEPAPAYTDGLESLICSMPWPCWEAIAVAACESGRDMSGRLDGQYATNGNHYGIFQISWVHADRFPGFYENWMDPAFNVQMAYTIWAEQGWYPWSCRPY